MLPDPVHSPACDPAVSWTSGNVAEAFPGVFTPLGYSMIDQIELAMRQACHEIGAITAGEIRVPARVEERYLAVFHGRGAGNMDRFRDLAGLLPGTSATALEQQLFGYVRPETVDRNTKRRYPFIAISAPRTMIGLSRRHDRCFAELRRWRLAALAGVDDLDAAACLRLLDDARNRFRTIMTLHFHATFAGSGLAEQVATMAAGRPGLEARLLSGVGAEENRVADDLWALAHRTLDLATFLDRHGYHGPDEGQLHSPSWREHPELLEPRLTELRAMGPDHPRAPRARATTQVAVRERALAELVAESSRAKGLLARLLVPMTARMLVLREQGKAGYLLTFDVARAAARRLGAQLAGQGALGDDADVFFLTWNEISGPVPADAADLVRQRRKQYDERQDQRLPRMWTGVPEPVAVRGADRPGAPGTRISGVGACAGIVEGRARVVSDPTDVDLSEGDILVCEATDPSWVSLFMVAAGVVTDMGGVISHGAIVAREMGIPCVCNTKTATATIRDGQRIRIDGSRGVVEILD